MPEQSNTISDKSLANRDQQVIWHPYTQMKNAVLPISIVKGEGAYLFDDAGNKYIDAISSWWVNIHGHAHPYIAEKVNEQFLQLEHVIFAGFTHPKAVELAERLLQRLPANQSKIFYSDNGSTAVEVGVKMALQYWQNQNIKKNKIIAFKDAYHGDTFGAMSVSGRSVFTQPFNEFLFHVDFIDVPVKGKEEVSVSQLEKLLQTNDVAAFIFEPLILGAGGMIMYEPESLEKLIKLCKEKNVITIADEVMTGFGRTGKFFATDFIDSKPDIICLSKGLTGGVMPLGVTSCSQQIFDAFLSDDRMKTFYHGHSFTANPVTCAAACASLDIFEQSETMKDVQRISSMHKEFISTMPSNPAIADIRQKGTILAIELKTNENTKYLNTIGDKARTFFLSKKIIIRPLGNVIYILPPYCIYNDDLKYIYSVIKEFIDSNKW